MWYETWMQDSVRNLGTMRAPERLGSAKCEEVRFQQRCSQQQMAV